VVLALVMATVKGSPALSGPRDTQDSPEEYIEQFTGRNATDCGKHGIADRRSPRAVDEPAPYDVALKASLECALKASMRPEAFRTVRQLQGIDSLVYEGLLGKPDGTIYWFSYDSAPCGGPGCAGRFEIRRCPVPGLASNQSVMRFSCGR
jgi:hypothetical protein